MRACILYLSRLSSRRVCLSATSSFTAAARRPCCAAAGTPTRTPDRGRCPGPAAETSHPSDDSDARRRHRHRTARQRCMEAASPERASRSRRVASAPCTRGYAWQAGWADGVSSGRPLNLAFSSRAVSHESRAGTRKTLSPPSPNSFYGRPFLLRAAAASGRSS